MSKVRQPTKEDLAAFGVEVNSTTTMGDDATPSADLTGLPTPDLQPDELYQKLDIPSPGFVLALYNKAFREGQHVLYEWQKEQLAEIGDSLNATVHNPYKLALCAANGSGKDYVIVAPTAVWMSLVNIRCLTIITSSSGTQLTAQTENYIKALCETVNEYHGQQIFRIRQRFIRCNLTGSEIRLFATDEAGKAEGYHPLEPDAKMMIIVNEAKSVSEEIFGALRRCTGYTHWLNVSTPGVPSGSFHRACTNLELGYRFRRVDYTHCSGSGKSHISEQERQTDLRELGANSALYRSKWMALFTTVDADTVLNLDHINLCLNVELSHKNWPIRIGIDIAAGGDETVLAAIRGNSRFAEIAFRDKDTVITANRLHEELTRLGIPQTWDLIYADDGGIGRSVIDMLREKGWTGINRILNQSRAMRPQQFGNRGAELWFNVRRLVEERVLNLFGWSKLLIEQLGDRRYKALSGGGRIFLESKSDAKAEGRHSPDRADAFILAHTGLTIENFLSEEVKQTGKPRHVLRTREEIENYLEQQDEQQFPKPGKRIYNSLAAALN